MLSSVEDIFDTQKTNQIFKEIVENDANLLEEENQLLTHPDIPMNLYIQSEP